MSFSRVDSILAEIESMRPIAPDRLGAAMQRLRIEWTYHSNAIEGNSLTYGETRAMLMHGVTASGKPLKDHLDIKGHGEALDYLEQLVGSNEILTLTAIREMHKLLLGDPYEAVAETEGGQKVRRMIVPGEFKTMPNHVRTETGEVHYYARPEEVAAMMQDLVDSIREYWDRSNESDVHPVLFATYVHHRFAEIHPFDDGSGRMARIIMNLILMRNGYPPAVVRQENRPRYYGALSVADGGDLEPLVEFISGELEHTMEIYIRALRDEVDLGAISQRIAIIKREITDKKIHVRSIESLADISERFILPLFKSVQGFIPEIYSLFDSSDSFISYKRVGYENYTSIKMGEVKSISHEWDEMNLIINLSGFVLDNSIDLEFYIEIGAKDRDINIVSSERNELGSFKYGQVFGTSEALSISAKFMSEMLNEIEDISRQIDTGD